MLLSFLGGPLAHPVRQIVTVQHPQKSWQRSLLVVSYIKSFVTPWTIIHQAPLSMGFPSHEFQNGLPFPSPGNIPDPSIKPMSPALAGELVDPGTELSSPALGADVLPTELHGKPGNAQVDRKPKGPHMAKKEMKNLNRYLPSKGTSQVVLVVKNMSSNANGEGDSNPLQYSCLENPVDRGDWWSALHEVAQSNMTEAT
ncbi:hypothetical protein MG293_000902 [Ovis ammon polii]|uniref:Uncharacterized protein n=1 Tax=Ovis ammon polii TaxID=230172 RepID=A0AAD4UPG0_OVIAM|nr:hypothetical protein MG293_000902 [Ovis ammon polii]